MSGKLVEMIGKGDPKSVLLNCAEQTQSDEEVLILVRHANGSYIRYGTEIPYEHLCGMLGALQELVRQAWE